MIATQLFAIVAWNIPSRKDATARPVKDVAAAVAAVTALPIHPGVSLRIPFVFGESGGRTSEEVEQDPVFNGEPYQDERGERLEGELRDVEERCKPTILRALEVRRGHYEASSSALVIHMQLAENCRGK